MQTFAKENRKSAAYFPPPAGSTGGAPRGKTHKNVGPCVSLSRRASTRSLQQLGSRCVSVLACYWPQQLPVPVSWDSVSAHPPLRFLGQLCALWPWGSEGSKKSCWFSVCSAFFSLWGWERWLLSSTCWNGNWKSLNTFLNQVVMCFIASYLNPLEKFRSKEQIISCIRSVHNCLNYPDGLLKCGGMWPQVSLRTRPALPLARFANAVPRPSQGRHSHSHEQGPDQAEESEAPRVRNPGVPDSPTSTVCLYSPKADISLHFAACVPRLVTLVPAWGMSTSSAFRLPASSLSAAKGSRVRK